MIQGSIVAIVTPMHADGEIDYGAFDRLLEWHISSGTDAIVVVGTTGESPTLSAQEHCDVVAHCVKRVAGRLLEDEAPFSAKITEKRVDLSASETIRNAVGEAEAELAARGRVVLRPSGTESVIRVMVEGEDERQVLTLAERLAAVVAAAAT